MIAIGVLVCDVTNLAAPIRLNYLNTRESKTTEESFAVLASVGDFDPEGLLFNSVNNSPNGKPLLVVGNEVSGTTALLQINLSY